MDSAREWLCREVEGFETECNPAWAANLVELLDRYAAHVTAEMDAKLKAAVERETYLQTENLTLRDAWKKQVEYTDFIRAEYQKRLEHVLDPVVRMKMLEPPPPIIIESAELLQRAQAAEEREKKLREALELMYDKWENGAPCFEDVEDEAGPLGNAFRLDNAEEAQVLSALACVREALK